MTHTHTKRSRSLGSKVRLEIEEWTNGWTDGGNCITAHANVVSNYHSRNHSPLRHLILTLEEHNSFLMLLE